MQMLLSGTDMAIPHTLEIIQMFTGATLHITGVPLSIHFIALICTDVTDTDMATGHSGLAGLFHSALAIPGDGEMAGTQASQ